MEPALRRCKVSSVGSSSLSNFSSATSVDLPTQSQEAELLLETGERDLTMEGAWRGIETKVLAKEVEPTCRTLKGFT